MKMEETNNKYFDEVTLKAIDDTIDFLQTVKEGNEVEIMLQLSDLEKATMILTVLQENIRGIVNIVRSMSLEMNEELTNEKGEILQ